MEAPFLNQKTQWTSSPLKDWYERTNPPADRDVEHIECGCRTKLQRHGSIPGQDQRTPCYQARDFASYGNMQHRILDGWRAGVRGRRRQPLERTTKFRKCTSLSTSQLWVADAMEDPLHKEGDIEQSRMQSGALESRSAPAVIGTAIFCPCRASAECFSDAPVGFLGQDDLFC